MLGREPALILGAINAVLAVAVGFGLPVTPFQVGLINAAVAAILAVVARQQVIPKETANAQIQTAIRMPSTADVKDVIAQEKANR